MDRRAALAHGVDTLVDLVTRRAEARPERRIHTYLVDGEQQEASLSSGQLAVRARAIGAELAAAARPGERALLLYPPGLDYVEAFFGCLHAGVVAVPAYPPNPSALERTLPRLVAIMRSAGASLVLTTSAIEPLARGLVAGVPELAGARWLATDTVPASSAATWRAPDARGDTLAMLQYTSGSTQAPKGVMLSHGNLLHNSRLIYRAFGHHERSSGVIWLPPYHDMGLIGGLIQPLYADSPVVLLSPLDFLQRPMRWLFAISRYRATTSGGPNFAYELCVRKSTPEQRAALDLGCWELAFNGAEPIQPDTLERFCAAFAPSGFRRSAVYPCFGLAEATLIATGGAPGRGWTARRFDRDGLAARRAIPSEDPAARPLVPCGGPITAEDGLAIVDPETGGQLPDGVVGEIWLSGPSVALGYFGAAEETARAFHARIPGRDAPHLRTGDLGFVLDGELFVTGRQKDLIILHGRNHYPQDLEQTVEACHPGLRPGCGAAFAIEAGGAEAVAIAYELEARHAAEAPAIVEAIARAVMREHEIVVHRVVLVEARTIPKTSSGKIQRHACRAAFLAGELLAIAQSPSPFPSPSLEAIRAWLIERVAATLGRPASGVDPRLPLAHLGLASLQTVGLTGELEEWLGRKLSPVLAYEHPTIDELARHLSGAAPRAAAPIALLAADEPIAVIGIGCRFPGARGPAAYWDLLRDGVDAVGTLSPERLALCPSLQRLVGRHPHGGFLTDLEQFDPAFFHLSMREAEALDPQQRLALEVAWEALADAGLPTDALAGSATGVFLGISTSDYARLPLAAGPHAVTGNALSIAANRISFALDLRGPSMAIDTACSSSLVAVHQAAEALRRGECALALAGGVSVILHAHVTECLWKGGFLSRDGRCRTFDARADGYVRGEGVGMVVLKPLSRALADGDRVDAVIRGSAVNNDGRSNGLTAPSVKAQEAVLAQAYARAGVRPSDVQYVEAHGTGTPLGDPIEAAALGAVLGVGRGRPCRVGSAKSNLGHLEAAAGIAGLVKTVLALRHRTLPASLHHREGNPRIPFATLGLAVQATTEPWPAHDGPALAGVSSFGFGGANAHVVLAEAPVGARAESRAYAPPAWRRVRCWTHAAARGDGAGGHPLLGAPLRLAAGRVWENVLDLDELPYLGDHRLGEHALLPATAFLEMALAAAPPTHGIVDVRLTRPLRLDTPRLTQVVLVEEGGREVFRVHSRAVDDPDGDWALHAEGAIAPAPALAAPALADVRARCRQPLSAAEHHDALAARGFAYGPSFRGLTAAWRGDDEIVARVEAPAAIAAELSRYRVHPAVLDACAQIVGALLPAGAPFAPVGARAVRVAAPATGARWSYARRVAGQAHAVDLFVFDDDGRVVVEVDGLQLRVLDARAEPIDRALYQVRWTEAALPPPAAERARATWLVLVDRAGVGGRLAAALRARGDRCVEAKAGAVYERLDADRVQLDPAAREPLRALLEEVRPDGVVHLWSLDVGLPADGAAIDRDLALCATSALHVFQDAAKPRPRRAPRQWLVTRATQPVGDGPVGSPLPATLWGLGRTVAQEHPEIMGGLVDLPPEAEPALDAERIARELDVPGGEAAWRQARHVPRLVRATAPAAPAALRGDGTYLVTGAVGALGLRVARGLVERGARRLILMGRTPLPPRAEWGALEPSGRAAAQVAAVRALEASGVSVHLAPVDVGAERDLAAYLERFRAEGWPPIRGVVHLAGVLQDRTLLNLDAAALADVFRAKVGGAWSLHRLLAQDPLDFFVLFSSVASVLGSAGQGNYAAGNAFLDALAHHRRGRGLPALAIDWGPWEELGLAAGSGERLARGGILGLAPEQGVELCQRLLGAQGQITVVPFDWAHLSSAIARLPILAELARAPSRRAAPSAAREALRALPPGDRLPRLVELLVAQIGGALGEKTPVRVDQPLDRMGLDSLMGVELRLELEGELGVELDMGLLMSGPTIAQLAAALLASIEGEGAAAEAPGDVAEPTLTAIQSAGARPPFFCVHPGALGTSVYAALAHRLGPEQPFYALSPRELEASYAAADRGPAAPGSIAILAARCVAVLRRRQPRGPYALGGWSLGGVIAFEMAAQLTHAGDEVALLALFDSPAPTAAARAGLDEAGLVPAFASYLAARQGLALGEEDDDRWRARSLDAQLATLAAVGEDAGLFPKGQPRERLGALFAAYRDGLAHATSHLDDYRPAAYAGRIVYFRARRTIDAYEAAFPRPADGWRTFATRPLELVELAGDHYSMLVEPHVRTFAAELARVLDRRP